MKDNLNNPSPSGGHVEKAKKLKITNFPLFL